MYSMMLKHLDTVKSISRVNLEKVISLSGHGDYSARPIDEFDIWSNLVQSGKCSGKVYGNHTCWLYYKKRAYWKL